MSKFTEIKITFPSEMDSEQARQELGEAVYKTTVQFYENIGEHGRLTDGKRILGNGHHMAQLIAEKSQKLWDERLTIKK